MKTNLFVLSILSLIALGCSSTVTKETTFQNTSKQGSTITTLKIDDKVINILKTQWEKEYIVAIGQAPVLKKYDNDTQNQMLARRAAVTDARRNLAEQINKVELTSTTTMADFSATDYVRTRVDAQLQDLEILVDRFDKEKGIYEIHVQMPKLKLLNIIEAYNKM
jgi:hypothetical protein